MQQMNQYIEMHAKKKAIKEQARASFRELPHFGCGGKHFEWPAAQYLRFSIEEPIKWIEFRYRKRGDKIHSIQATLSNG